MKKQARAATKATTMPAATEDTHGERNLEVIRMLRERFPDTLNHESAGFLSVVISDLKAWTRSRDDVSYAEAVRAIRHHNDTRLVHPHNGTKATLEAIESGRAIRYSDWRLRRRRGK